MAETRYVVASSYLFLTVILVMTLMFFSVSGGLIRIVCFKARGAG